MTLKKRISKGKERTCGRCRRWKYRREDKIHEKEKEE
jgi:hypothetical protein